MKRKLFAIFLAIFLITSLAGCQQQATQDTEVPTLTEGKLHQDGIEFQANTTSEIHYGDTIILKSYAFTNHLSGRAAGDHAAVQLARLHGAWEEWVIINPDQPDYKGTLNFKDMFALQSKTWGNYLSGRDGKDNSAVQLMKGIGPWEKWSIVNPDLPDSGLPVKPIDTVELKSLVWGNYLSARGADQDEVVELMKTPKSWEKWYIAPYDFLRHWMQRTPEIHNKKLAEICFPATHDSGTWSFTDEMATESESKPLRDALKMGDDLVKEIGEIPGIGLVFPEYYGLKKIKEDVYDIIFSGTKGLAIATDATVAQQLDAGIRYLDLRVYLKPDGAYTHHTLVGTSISDIVNSIRDFLAGTSGEVLIVQMSHFIADDNSQLKDLFLNFNEDVYRRLKPYAYIPENIFYGVPGNPALRQTYNTVFTQSSAPGSRVILIMDGAPIDVSQTLFYWTPGMLGIEGKYSNTTDKGFLISDQFKRLSDAKSAGAPFALYVTLTPQTDDCKRIVINKVATELPGRMFKYIKVLQKEIEKVIKDWLNGYIWNGDWTTLKQLSQKVDSDFAYLLTQHYQNTTTDNNHFTVIFADFFETTSLVEMAILYSRLPSSGSLETIKSR